MAKEADPSKPDPSKPAGPPKPVHIGGESIADRLLPHIKKILVGVIVLAVVLSAAFGFRACKRTRQAAETQKVAGVFATGMKPVAEPGTPPDPVKNPGFANLAERAQAMLDEAARTGAELAPEVKASLLLDAGKVDEAIAEYRRCESGLTIEAVLCREGLGIALETKATAETDSAARQKGLEEALEVFTRMQPVEDGPRRAYALYHQARLMGPRLLNKPAEAKALLEQAKQLSPPPDLVEMIDQRLAALGAE
jgi:hypothetical protein